VTEQQLRLLIAATLVGPIGLQRNTQGAIVPHSAEHAFKEALALADGLIAQAQVPA
jgi:hypothetical protein